MNSRLNVLPKSFKCSKLHPRCLCSAIELGWRKLLCWRKAFSARDVRRTVTDSSIFFLGRLLAFYLNAIWAHFLGTKLRFHPKYCFWCSFGEIKFDLTLKYIGRNMTASLTHCNGEAENFSFLHLSCLIVTKQTKWHVRPAKTRISLGMRPVWSESTLCAQWVAKDRSFLHADSEDSDQTGWMPRLIWVFSGRTCHFVGFVMGRLINSFGNYLGSKV